MERRANRAPEHVSKYRGTPNGMYHGPCTKPDGTHETTGRSNSNVEPTIAGSVEHRCVLIPARVTNKESRDGYERCGGTETATRAAWLHGSNCMVAKHIMKKPCAPVTRKAETT